MKNLIHIPPKRDELIKSLDQCLRIIDPEFREGSVLYNTQGVIDAAMLDYKGRYLHWDDIKNRHQDDSIALAKWSIIKTARKPFFTIAYGYVSDSVATYITTPNQSRIASLVDRNCTTAGLNALTSAYRVTDESFLDFADEESIASSQLEGAATTRIVARKMLRDGRRPRTEGEHMIICNRRLMDMAWNSRHKDMSVDLLLDFHREATAGINDKNYRPGELRTTDDVWVGDDMGNMIHRPPEASTIKPVLHGVMQWANEPHEHEIAWKQYMHPMTKAIILHFLTGYIHPFYDGNGRVARALCYWMLFRAGYSAFRYISISGLLKQAPKEYVRAYLKTETDDMDLTYFIEYQAGIIERAVNNLITHIKDSSLRLRDLFTWMAESGISVGLSDLQMSLITAIVYFPEREHTVKSVTEKYGVARSTAVKALETLVSAGVMTKSGGSGRTPVIFTGRKSHRKLKEGLINLQRG